MLLGLRGPFSGIPGLSCWPEGSMLRPFNEALLGPQGPCGTGAQTQGLLMQNEHSNPLHYPTQFQEYSHFFQIVFTFLMVALPLSYTLPQYPEYFLNAILHTEINPLGRN